MIEKLNNHFIKYSGSKRTLAPEIIKYIPKEINLIIEPFCGSASFSFACMHNNLPVEKYILSDTNNDIIKLLKTCRDNPSYLVSQYKVFHKNYNKIDNIQYRKGYYHEIRNLFNETRDSGAFLFIIRTCVNGLIRYNRKKEFNASCHFSRPGIDPLKLEEQIYKYSNILQHNKVDIVNLSYLEFDNNDKDTLYFLDPPYLKSKEMYFGEFDSLKFKDWISGKQFLLTHDDQSDFFSNYDYVDLSPQKSSFRLLKGEVKDVSERLFINI